MTRDHLAMVLVAQQVALPVVVRAVAGSSPVKHPRSVLYGTAQCGA